MFADDEIRNRFRIRQSVGIARIRDDFLLGIYRQLSGHGNELGPVHMMAEIGSGGEDGVREVDDLDEERERDERDEEDALALAERRTVFALSARCVRLLRKSLGD